jgi:hypothetical protein
MSISDHKFDNAHHGSDNSWTERPLSSSAAEEQTVTQVVRLRWIRHPTLGTGSAYSHGELGSELRPSVGSQSVCYLRVHCKCRRHHVTWGISVVLYSVLTGRVAELDSLPIYAVRYSHDKNVK